MFERKAKKAESEEVIRTFRDGTTVVNASALIRRAAVKKMLYQMADVKFKRVRRETDYFEASPIPPR